MSLKKVEKAQNVLLVKVSSINTESQKTPAECRLEKPSVAIIEALRQRQFGDWVAPDSENWLEQISQLVSDRDLPVSSDRISPELKVFKPLSEFMLLEGGGKQLVIPQKNVDEQREQLKLS